MPLTLSIYLDLIRFIASLGVFLEHLSSEPMTSEVIWGQLGRYGAVSVTVFFVLSGYVIAYVSANRENTPGSFIGSRVSRLYSVVIPALVLTYVFDSIGMSLNPELYASHRILWKPESWAGYISSLFFVDEYRIFGFHGISPGTNGPYWSLSFEATYYTIAGLILFTPLRFALPVAMLLLFVAGRTVAALLPVWLLGFYLYRYGGHFKLGLGASLLALLVSATLLLELPAISSLFPVDNWGHYFPWGRGAINRNLSADYLAAGIFAVHLLAARQVANHLKHPFKRAEPVIRWLGSLTFPLYCFHFPALCLFRALSPWPEDSWQNAVFLATAVFALTALLTPLCDLFKVAIRNRISSPAIQVAPKT
jgi:peptidoglycan/LPS O-acetylase OafA/YrhL